jgi:SAM-dependent methyltransferase
LDHVHVYLSESTLPAADRKELRFWKEDPRYNRASSLWENLKVKAGELRMFEALLPLLAPEPGVRVLELGAGQGWASLMLKRSHADCEVHASDLSPEAMLGAEKWERLLETRLDGYWACGADRTPFADEQFDRVFTFAAFHHFAVGDRARAALAECLRVLKPRGRLVLLMEPCAPAWLQRWSKRRLDRIRLATAVDIEEEVLVPGHMQRWARDLGARLDVRFDTSWSWREIRLPGILRNAAVRQLPALGWLVPMGAHFTFTKTPRP